MSELMRVTLHEETPSRQWVVELERLGGRIDVYRSATGQEGPALALAEQMARFLGCDLVRTVEGKRESLQALRSEVARLLTDNKSLADRHLDIILEAVRLRRELEAARRREDALRRECAELRQEVAELTREGQ